MSDNALRPGWDYRTARNALQPDVLASGAPNPDATAGLQQIYADWQARGANMPPFAQWLQGLPMQGLGFVGGVKAYHGSPHSFDQFDTSKIGTGEGAQAYGHGLYFAENEGVAQGYRRTLSEGAGGTNKVVRAGNDTLDINRLPGAQRTAALELIDAGGDFGKAEQWIRQQYYPETVDAHVAALTALRERGATVADAGHTYEVNINAHPDDFLHWDKPLSEQSPKVRDALTKLGVKTGGSATDAQLRPYRDALEASLQGTPVEPFARHIAEDMAYGRGQWDAAKVRSSMTDPAAIKRMDDALAGIQELTGPQNPAQWQGITGAHAYDALHDLMPQGEGEAFQDALGRSTSRDVQIAKSLSDAGIPGIRYLDQGSRGAGEGTSNYVVFSPENIEILRKYGIAGLGLTGLAGAGTAYGGPPPTTEDGQ